ncbi:MAG: tRNA (guanosine(37)-N1)-methyltransferase TrmD [Verrucomicrobiaceae bacterium]|nr:tRNA (guanosine(37)-N1)-methyltransferase TrmD [Verrucomicrobiaceae bacterium]
MLLEAITLFPELIEIPMRTSIMGRAQEKGIINVKVHQLREQGLGRHRQVDDTPFGGGPGMVLRPEPLFDLFEKLDRPEARIIYMSPAGRPFDQAAAHRLAGESHLIFLCGHYEGIDQRVIDHWVDDELSIGDYVLTNGAIAASIVMDAVVRLLPGVLGDDLSSVEESFGSTGLLEGPQYTKPAEFRDMRVPDILLSGNHAKIAAWRAEQSRIKTAAMRPDLLENK